MCGVGVGPGSPTLSTAKVSGNGKARKAAGLTAKGVATDTTGMFPQGTADASSDVWASWPAAWIDRQGVISQAHPDALAVIGQVLMAQAGNPPQLEAAANRRLWAMVDQDSASLQWKVLDPVHWPFIGIIGWATKSPTRLQLAAWNITCLPWHVDDAWRKLLAATAAVKARRRRSVA